MRATYFYESGGSESSNLESSGLEDELVYEIYERAAIMETKRTTEQLQGDVSLRFSIVKETSPVNFRL